MLKTLTFKLNDSGENNCYISFIESSSKEVTEHLHFKSMNIFRRRVAPKNCAF